MKNLLQIEEIRYNPNNLSVQLFGFFLQRENSLHIVLVYQDRMVINELKWIHMEPTLLNYGNHPWSRGVSLAIENIKKSVANFSASGIGPVNTPRYIPGIKTKSERLALAEKECVDLSNQLKIAEKERTMLNELAYIDQLTQIPNRRAFDNMVEWYLREHSRNGKFLTIMLMDIDKFKTYNDTYGHPEGDACLFNVAQKLNETKRPMDMVARFGWEEFAYIMFSDHLNDQEAAAERLRQTVENCGMGVTISMGVCTIPPGHLSTNVQMYEFADRALYEAKNNGRNRIVYSDVHNAQLHKITPIYKPSKQEHYAI